MSLGTTQTGAAYVVGYSLFSVLVFAMPIAFCLIVGRIEKRGKSYAARAGLNSPKISGQDAPHPACKELTQRLAGGTTG